MSYEPELMQVPYATVGAPPDGAPQPRPSSGWGPLITVVVIGFTLLLGYVGYRVAMHYLSHPNPYTVRHAATGSETTVVFPPRLAGLTRMDGRYDDLLAKTGRGAPVGYEIRFAIYGRSGTATAVVGAGSLPIGKYTTAQLMTYLREDLQKRGVVHLTDVDAGPLGGRMACGDDPVMSDSTTACGYVDSGAFGVVYLAGRGSRAQATVLALRAGIEQRVK